MSTYEEVLREAVLAQYRDYAKMLRARLYQPGHFRGTGDSEVPNVEKFYADGQVRSTERFGKIGQDRHIALAPHMRITPKGRARWPVAIEWRPHGSGLGMATWALPKTEESKEEARKYPFGRVALSAYVRWIDSEGRHGFTPYDAFCTYEVHPSVAAGGLPPGLSEQARLELQDNTSSLRIAARAFLLSKLDGVSRGSTAPSSKSLPTATLLALISSVPAWAAEFSKTQE